MDVSISIGSLSVSIETFSVSIGQQGDVFGQHGELDGRVWSAEGVTSLLTTFGCNTIPFSPDPDTIRVTDT